MVGLYWETKTKPPFWGYSTKRRLHIDPSWKSTLLRDHKHCSSTMRSTNPRFPPCLTHPLARRNSSSSQVWSEGNASDTKECPLLTKDSSSFNHGVRKKTSSSTSGLRAALVGGEMRRQPENRQANGLLLLGDLDGKPLLVRWSVLQASWACLGFLKVRCWGMSMSSREHKNIQERTRGNQFGFLFDN